MAMPVIAAGVALLPLAARLHGMRDYAAVRREIGHGVRAAALYVLLLVAPLTLLLGPAVARALADAPETVAYAREALFWLPVAVAGTAPFLLTRAAWDGLTRPLPGLLAACTRSFLVLLPAVWLALRWHAALGLGPMQAAAIASCAASLLAAAAFWLWSSAALRRVARGAPAPPAVP
jgi:Na+-driven multidrug efflux pump